MELQRAPYLKNLKRKSEQDKFVQRRNEMIETKEKTVFTPDEMEILAAGIKEKNEIIRNQNKTIKRLAARVAALKSGLEPFASFACEGERSCHNCHARDLIDGNKGKV